MSNILTVALVLVGGVLAWAAFAFEMPQILVGLFLVSGVSFFVYANRQIEKVGDLPPMKPAGRRAR
ncbi:MAG: hypothetical protein AAFQ67_00845 [Pseudomonadota bacterium]